MESLDWKKIGMMCGQSLDTNNVNALSKLSLTKQMSTSTLRDHICSVLQVLGPYSNYRLLAWELACVVKYGKKTCESWVICFGEEIPFKIKCRLPDKHVLSAKEVKDYVPRVELSKYDGSFIQVHGNWTEPICVYVYSFANSSTEACSTIGELHNSLPVPKRSRTPITDDELVSYKALNIGNAYMHLNASATATTCTDKTVHMEFLFGEKTRHGSEEDRVDFLFKHLESSVVPLYQDLEVSKVYKVSKKEGNNFCCFTGGGDLMLRRNDAAVVMSFTDTAEDDLELGDTSPIGQGESRSTVDIECKVSNKSESDIQLQANMYNLIVRQFMDKLKNVTSLESLSQLTQLTIYGISFGTGLSSPILVLKMTIDFTATALIYEEKYVSTSSLPKELLIDCCTSAVLNRLSKKSPSPLMRVDV